MLLERLFFLSEALAQTSVGGQPPQRDLVTILNDLIGFATGLALTIAALVIIYAAYLMLTAGGNSEQFEKGKKTITYVVIGLFVLLLSRAIVTIIRELIIGP